MSRSIVIRRIHPISKPMALIGSLALLAACGTGSGDVNSEDPGSLDEMTPVVLTVSDPNPETSSNAIALTEWMEFVTEETEGKVTFETYFSGTLHDGSDALSALEQDLTDITFYYPGFFADQMPVASWTTRSFGIEAAVGFPHTALASGPATAVLYEESEDLQEELARHNATPLAFLGSATFDLLCTKPVESLEDARGILVNTSGPPWVDEVAALNMTAEFIEIPEEYEALQRGVIDCATTQPSPLMTRGSWEVAKSYTPVNLSPSLGSGYVFNKETWDDLPLEVRQIMHDGKSTIVARFAEIFNERYAEFAEEAEEMDVEFLDPTQLNAEVGSYHHQVADEVVSSAPVSASNPQADLDLFSSEMGRWRSSLVDDLSIAQVEQTPENIEELYLSVREIDWEGYKVAIDEALAHYRPE